MYQSDSDYIAISLHDLVPERQIAITQTIDCYQIINDLIDENLGESRFLLTGGFPLALLFGKIEDGFIAEQFYKDIDIVASHDITNNIKYLAYKNGIPVTYESNLAITFKNDYQEIQYITVQKADSLAYLKHYDLINSQIVYDPINLIFYLHKQLSYLMETNEIALSPWLLQNEFENYLDPDKEQAIYRTINRIIKYSNRWNLKLTHVLTIEWFLYHFKTIAYRYKNSTYLPGYNSTSLVNFNPNFHQQSNNKDIIFDNAIQMAKNSQWEQFYLDTLLTIIQENS